jgi:hypothetical protein
LQRRA